MIIEFQGEFDSAVVKKAVKLMSKAPFWMIALRIAITILILVTLGSLVYSYFSGESIPTSKVLRLVIQDLFLGYFIVQPYFASNTLYKRLSQGNHKTIGSVTPIGISYKAASGDQVTEYPWDAFVHVFKLEDLIVLSTADWRISILPRSFFADEQEWKHFIQYVDSRVVPAR